MRNALKLAAAVLGVAIAASSSAYAAESTDQQSNSQRSAQPPNDSIKQGIKNDAAEVKRSVKDGAAEVKRKLAVAQCNDGRYSYTHHLTCNHHGGVKRRFR